MVSQAQFIEQRPLWLVVLFTSLGLEIAALYFQYVMGFEPCIKCIYTRVAVFGLALAGLIGALKPSWLIFRLLGYSTFIMSAIWGIKITTEHVKLQTDINPLFAVCDSIPDFPGWFQPHIWLPSVFEVRGSCGEVDWQLFNLSMPQWMQIIFIAYLVVFTLVLIYRLFAVRKL